MPRFWTVQIALFLGWLNESRIYRISGWSGWQREEGTVAVNER